MYLKIYRRSAPNMEPIETDDLSPLNPTDDQKRNLVEIVKSYTQWTQFNTWANGKMVSIVTDDISYMEIHGMPAWLKNEVTRGRP